MPYRRVFQSGLSVLAATVLPGACAGVPTRGAPGRYEQSFDSATGSCRQNPTLCTRMAGEELVVPQATQRLAEVGASAAVVAMALEGDLRTRIEQALKECAEYARSQVLIDERHGQIPTSDECNEMVPGRDVTLAMFLGEQMPKLALQCEGHPHQGFAQDARYWKALGVQPVRVMPGWGVMP